MNCYAENPKITLRVSIGEAITGLKTHVDEGYTAKKRSFCRTGLR